MIRSALALCVLSCTACAVGLARPNGTALGFALGQAEIRACTKPAAAPEAAEAACSYIRGAAISEGGTKALGLLPSVLQLLIGAFS